MPVEYRLSRAKVGGCSRHATVRNIGANERFYVSVYVPGVHVCMTPVVIPEPVSFPPLSSPEDGFRYVEAGH